MKNCKICANKYYAKGLCKAHYEKKKKQGDASIYLGVGA